MIACVLRCISVLSFGYAASKASECSSVPFGGLNTRSYVPGLLVMVKPMCGGICRRYDNEIRNSSSSCNCYNEIRANKSGKEYIEVEMLG
jgi:hypothetical protein